MAIFRCFSAAQSLGYTFSFAVQLLSQFCQIDIFQVIFSHEIKYWLSRAGIIRSDGRFQKNAQVGRLVLDAPVGLGKPQCVRALAQQVQGEAGFFPLVNEIAAQMSRFESCFEG